MSATTATAIYAATIATITLAWQIVTRLASRRPKIRVELRHSALTVADMGEQLVYHVTVAATNRGETAETVEAVGVQGQGGGIDDRENLSEPLPPGGVVKRTFALLAIDVFDPTLGITPFVEIASRDARISGRREELNGGLLEKCWPVTARHGEMGD